MAHKSSTGTVKNGRDSISKRLGLKITNNQCCKKGQILIRQRGLTFIPGKNVEKGKDFTLYALKGGIIKFNTVVFNHKSKKKINVFENNWEKLLNVFQYKTFFQLKRDLDFNIY